MAASAQLEKGSSLMLAENQSEEKIRYTQNKWEKTGLLQGLIGLEVINMAFLLEAQAQHIVQNEFVDDAVLTNLIFPLVRAVFQNIKAKAILLPAYLLASQLTPSEVKPFIAKGNKYIDISFTTNIVQSSQKKYIDILTKDIVSFLIKKLDNDLDLYLYTPFVLYPTGLRGEYKIGFRGNIIDSNTLVEQES